jgi:hypothetical protein
VPTVELAEGDRVGSVDELGVGSIGHVSHTN